jgi:uncharacterized membrane protein YdjX (TVP38/TMEM64 family)
MKLLIKSVLILMGIFVSSLIIIKLTGILTIEDIKEIFNNLKSQPPHILGLSVVFLLFIDLFIAVPTMTIIILAGYFIGFELGMLYSLIGLIIASFTGYLGSWKYGNKLLDKLSSNELQKKEMMEIFNKHGFLVIILSRAVPMLPEISSCLAGTCKIPLQKYLMAWTLGTIPYVSIMSYTGSISDLENPMPAIYTVIGITLLFSLLWFLFMKFYKLKGKNI